jgi:IS1 family transposase
VIVTLELIEHLVSGKKKAARIEAGKETLRKLPRKNRPTKPFKLTKPFSLSLA